MLDAVNLRYQVMDFIAVYGSTLSGLPLTNSWMN